MPRVFAPLIGNFDEVAHVRINIFISTAAPLFLDLLSVLKALFVKRDRAASGLDGGHVRNVVQRHLLHKLKMS